MLFKQSCRGPSGPPIGACETYLRQHPDDREARLAFIRRLRRRSNYGEAENQLDKLLAANPGDDEVLALKAELLDWTRDGLPDPGLTARGESSEFGKKGYSHRFSSSYQIGNMELRPTRIGWQSRFFTTLTPVPDHFEARVVRVHTPPTGGGERGAVLGLKQPREAPVTSLGEGTQRSAFGDMRPALDARAFGAAESGRLKAPAPTGVFPSDHPFRVMLLEHNYRGRHSYPPIGTYETYLRQHPGDTEVHVAFIYQLGRRGNYGEAENQLDRLLAANAGGNTQRPAFEDPPSIFHVSLNRPPAVQGAGRQASSGVLPSDYPARVAALEQAYRDDPADEAVVDALVGSYAMGSDYDKAIVILERFLRQHSASLTWRLRLVRLYAWSGRADEALKRLEGIADADHPEVAELECRLLSDLGRARAAAACYQDLLRRPSGDEKKRAAYQLQMARNQAWATKTHPAIRAYEAYLRQHRDDREVHLEFIRQLRYRGNYGEAENQLDKLLAANPSDDEVLALKAEVLHWAGNRSFEARAAAESALTIAPDNLDAQVARVYALRSLGENRAALLSFEQLRQTVDRAGGVRPESTYGGGYRDLERILSRPLRLQTLFPAAVYHDSDGIHDVTAGVQIGIPIRHDHTLRLNFLEYNSSAPLSSPFTAGRERSRLREFSLGGTIHARAGLDVTLMGGGTQRSTFDEVRPTFDVTVNSSPLDRWTFAFSVAREFLTITPRAIDLDISSYRFAADASHAFNTRTSLGFSVDRRLWSDDNTSTSANAVIRRILRYSKPFMIDIGARSRLESFAEDTKLASGFFTPDQLWRHEGFLELRGEIGHRFQYDFRGAAGTQRILRSAPYRLSWEAASSLQFRLTNRVSLTLNYCLVSRICG